MEKVCLYDNESENELVSAHHIFFTFIRRKYYNPLVKAMRDVIVTADKGVEGGVNISL